MIRRFYCIFLFLSLSISTTVGQGYFSFSSDTKAAYGKVMELRVEEASLLLAKVKREEPENRMVYFVENYLDFIRIFIDENEREFENLEKNKARRIQLIKGGDRTSPYYLYTQAEIKLQWALVRLKFGEYITALYEVKSAYKLLNKNLKKFPDFLPSKKSLGILHALVGTIPDNYRWAFKFLSGMDGTIEQGRQEIEEVLEFARQQGDFLFEEETLVIYSFLLLHLNNNQEEAWRLIQSGGRLNPAQSPLACFAIANMAMRIGRNDEAIRLLENRPQGEGYYAFHFLDFMLGLAKLRRLDRDADVHLEHYILHFRGQNYIKEAYQKLAWHHLLNGDEPRYKRLIKQCKIKGQASVSNDKSAKKEAQQGIIPHPILLKARVLFDGGYYQRAYQLLAQHSPDQFSDPGLRLEYVYRLGRISDELDQLPLAFQYYQQTIDQGREQKYYYACNAALKSAILYEEQKDYVNAEKYYELCLSMKPNEYKSSLHGMAKAGLNRIENR
ncbi:MAG: hypothetical protein AAF985_00945 [Bacteroidota bacterium]